jgi:hypothetical protein
VSSQASDQENEDDTWMEGGRKRERVREKEEEVAVGRKVTNQATNNKQQLSIRFSNHPHCKSLIKTFL